MGELQQRTTLWLLRKAGGILAILAIILGTAGVWSYLRDAVDIEGKRQEVMQVLTGERHRLMEAKARVQERKAAEQRELGQQQQRVAIATRGIRTIDELESPWQRWFGGGAKGNLGARRADLAKLRSSAEARAKELGENLKIEDYTLEGLDVAMGKVDRRMGLLQSTEPIVVRYAKSAWIKTRAYVITALAAWLLGPLLGKLLLYFVVAPPVSRGRPIRFSDQPATGVRVSGSNAALDVGLREGELLRVKETFLQASDEGLLKRMRWIFDWRIPFASWACGLVELVELRHPGGSSGDYRVTIASSEDSSTEFSLVELPEGDSLIVRPWFIAGVVLAQGSRLRIRRRWVFGRWQAWMTMQFRFFEFEGPCRLVLAGSRGIRVETLALPADRISGRDPARRANQQAIIGFTPGLEYRPVRAETFWAYYRGMNPLFDELFVGQGLFLCQASAGGRVQSSSRFWQFVWRGLRRAVGL